MKILQINKKKILYILILFSFSILFNQYVGFIGINPIDSFFSFNSGYDILNGHFPFKDFWTSIGPLIDLTQAFFFKLFGVSWFSYVLHASIFNAIFVISTFYTLYKLNLNLNYCFLYAFSLSILAYPSSGTPYVDHQASYMSLIAIYCFILGMKTNLNFYWFILPIIFGLSFLAKQTPTGHIFLITSVLSLVYFSFNFDIKKIINIFLGSVTIVIAVILFLLLGKISIVSFFEQYITYPLSIGESRIEFLYPFDIKKILLRFKIIHFFSFTLIFIIIKNIINDKYFIKKNDFLSMLLLIFSSFALIAHQLMTINGLYIFFVIPILAGFAHIYSIKYSIGKKYILYLFITITLVSSAHYGNKYILSRDFADLRNININKAVNANILDSKLNGLKWITPLYPNDPNKELELLNNVINIIKKDKRQKVIITDYQFISVILGILDNSPNQVWFINHMLNQDKNSKFFKIYKKFLIEKLKVNEIEIIYIVKPLWGGDIFAKSLNNSCFKKIKVTKILDTYLIQQCEDLKN